MKKKTIKVIYDSQHLQHQPLTYPSTVGLEDYPEKTARVESIMKVVTSMPLCEIVSPAPCDETIIAEIHSLEYINFLKSLENKLTDDAYYYPTEVFHPTASRKPAHILAELGTYSFDLSAPVNRHIFKQAFVSASCALTAAQMVTQSNAIAYSLCRPPGHHAMKEKMGGFCYINNTALAAQFLSRSGKVAILDVDYHHGNGTQDIFYNRPDVLTISIHADPSDEYPYYWGYADETGIGNGAGFNINYPCSKNIGPVEYHSVLEKAVADIQKYAPQYLVIALGLDTYKKDPLGTFKLNTEYYRTMAETISRISVPKVIVQEGGYYIPDLGQNASAFLEGLQ